MKVEVKKKTFYSQVESLVEKGEQRSPLSLGSVLWGVTEPNNKEISIACREFFNFKTLSLAQVEGRHRGPPGSVCLLCGSRFPGKVKVILLLQTIVEIWLLQIFVEARIYSPVCECLPSNWQTLTSPSRDSFAT